MNINDHSSIDDINKEIEKLSKELKELDKQSEELDTKQKELEDKIKENNAKIDEKQKTETRLSFAFWSSDPTEAEIKEQIAKITEENKKIRKSSSNYNNEKEKINMNKENIKNQIDNYKIQLDLLREIEKQKEKNTKINEIKQQTITKTKMMNSESKKNEVNYINNSDLKKSNNKKSTSKEETRTSIIRKLTKRITSLMPMKEFEKIFNFVINEQQMLNKNKKGLEDLVSIIENENIKSFGEFKEIFLNEMKAACEKNNIQIPNDDNIKFNNLTDYVNFFKKNLQDQNNYDLTLENFTTDYNKTNVKEAENKFNNAINEKKKLNLFEKILTFFFDYKGINKKIALAKIDLIEAKQHFHKNKINLLKNKTRKAQVYQEKMTDVSLRAINDMKFNWHNLYNSYNLTQNIQNQQAQHNQNQISAIQTNNNLITN